MKPCRNVPTESNLEQTRTNNADNGAQPEEEMNQGYQWRGHKRHKVVWMVEVFMLRDLEQIRVVRAWLQPQVHDQTVTQTEC